MTSRPPRLRKQWSEVRNEIEELLWHAVLLGVAIVLAIAVDGLADVMVKELGTNWARATHLLIEIAEYVVFLSLIGPSALRTAIDILGLVMKLGEVFAGGLGRIRIAYRTGRQPGEE